MALGKSQRRLVLAFKILLIIAIFIGAIYLAKTHPVVSESVNQYTTSDVAYADGQIKHFSSKNFGIVNAGDVVTLRLRLPENPIFERATLAFYTFNAVTQVWCGGVLLDSYGADIAEKGMMLGNHDFLVDVPDEAWGAEITIIVRATESPAFSNFTNLKVYPSQRVYRYYMDSDPIGFVIAIALFIFALVGLVACALGTMRGAVLISGLCLSMVALLVSLWMISNKGIYTLFGFTDYFWQPLEYIAGYTIAIPLLLFYRGMTDKQSKWNRVFGIAAYSVSAFFVVATVLNFTNVMHYDALMDAAGLLILASGTLLIAYTLQMRSDGSRKQAFLRTGMFIFVPACLYEAFIRGIYRLIPLAFLHNLPSLIALGILFLLLCLIGAFVTDQSDKQKDLLSAQIKADTLNQIIAATPAGICQLVPDEKLTIVSANNIFYRIMGYRDAELQSGKPRDAFIHLYDNEKAFLREKIAEILNNSQNEGEFEFSTTDIDGKPLTIIIRYFFDRNGSGNITANLIDITDRKKMEEDLRVSEERYKLALTQSGKVFFFFDVPTRTMRLSPELANAFGLPVEVDNMPDNFISQGLVEPQSVENYRHFYERIIAGDKSGDTIISCHMRNAPQTVLWYRIAFTSVFDAQGNPASAIITYEDLMEQRAAEIAGKWKQLNLVSIPEKQYVVAEYNLTQNRILNQYGGLFAKMPEFITGFDEISDFVLDNFIYEDDVAGYRAFLNRSRLIEMFEAGQTEDQAEYRSLQRGSEPRWTSTSIQMIRDPYSNDILAQLLFRDINAERVGQIEMRQNVEELKKELENSRIKVMINQMQPHFLYNALSAIQTIVKIDPDYAYQLIYDFTVHLRSSIKALSSDAPIPFTDELKNIKAYLNIEIMRFGDSLKVNYEIDCKDFYVIPLSIQPLAENAARHGVYPKGEAGGTVTIRTYEKISSYVVEVEDDGMGFDAADVLDRQSDSVGLKSLIFRLKSLMNADVSIDSKPNVGTRVTVTIPKKEE